MEKTSPQPSTSPQPTAAPPPPQPSPQPPPSSSSSSTPSASEPPPPPSSSSSSPSLQPPPNPQTPAPPISHHQPQLFQLQQRPPLPRARPQPPYPPFSHPLTSQPPASAAASPSPSARGGVAMGVPAHHHARPSQPPVSLSPFGGPSQAFNQQFSPLARNPGGTPEQSSVSNPQVRQPIPGVHSIGMFASLSSGSQIRPSGMPTQHQQRPSHPIMRTSSPSINQSSSSQNQQKFHTSGLSRGGPSMASPSSQSPVPQSSQPLQQHLTSTQGKQIHTAPLSSSSLRPQMKSQALPQRPLHLQPHNQTLMATSHQQQTPSSQPQQVQQQQHASQSQEHHSQQYSQLRNQQPLSQQQQAARAHGSASQRSNVPPSVQSGGVHPGATNPMGSADDGESSNQILGKRSIRELVTQIDPFEKLDPEVEDVLVEIADDFIESITTFACSLAKHRKSTTLEAKDILLHVERNWNMTLPGFGGDEIKCYKKQLTNDIHKERLAAVKKSMSGTGDTSNAKNPPSGQAPLSGKSHAAKMPTSASQAERAS